MFCVSVPFRGISFPNTAYCSMAATTKVSVPFRGISFPNLEYDIKHTENLQVSVPFRGISFPNTNLPKWIYPSSTFPSPSGASHFQIKMKKYRIEFGFGFPSPSGASHFQITQSFLILLAFLVSVPFRGISFPNLSFQSLLTCPAI